MCESPGSSGGGDKGLNVALFCVAASAWVFCLSLPTSAPFYSIPMTWPRIILQPVIGLQQHQVQIWNSQLFGFSYPHNRTFH